MISWITFLSCLLIVAADENEFWLKYNKSSIAHFKERDLRVFISSKTIKPNSAGDLSYSLSTQGSFESWETLHCQSFFMVCSSLPSFLADYSELAVFLKNSCESVIPITTALNNEESSLTECSCGNSTTRSLLLISFVTEKQLISYLNNQQSSVYVRIIDGPCDHQLKTVVGVQTLQNTYHSDITYSVFNSGSASLNIDGLVLRFGGIIETTHKCRNLIAWMKHDGTFSYLMGTDESTLALNGTANGTSILMRCIFREENGVSEIDHSLITFLSYYSDQAYFTLDESHFDHPPISPENPYICFNHALNSSTVYIPITDTKISGITPFNGVRTTQVTIHACLSKFDSRGKMCDGNFLPIFSESPITLNYNSSFFLGPSFGRDLIALILNGRNHTAFCLDLELAKNAAYMVDVMLFAAPGGSLPPNSHHYIDLSCPNNYDENLSAIMYRTHTHKLGQYVSMWVEHKDTWTLIASENRTNAIVQLPEPFNIRANDIMNVRCSYDTLGMNKTIYIGENGEMCNFYLYIIRNVSSHLDIRDCFRETLLNPPNRDREIDHQLSRHLITFDTNLEHVASWSIQAQSSNDSLAISSLEHTGAVLVTLKSHANDFSRNLDGWFDDHNVLINFLNVIKTNALTVFSMQNSSILHSAAANRFYLPSSLHVSSEGKIFITDLGLHQVVMFSRLYFQPRDAPELVLGTAFDPGNDSSHFCKPTSVLTDHEENIFVGDGLCNTRIVKFEDDGHYVGSFGLQSSERSLSGTFGEVTDLALDVTREVILALDNKLKQIQVMDFLGNFYKVIDVSKYKNVLKISYSPDMDAILILTSYGLDSGIFILDPVTGVEISYISGETRRFTALTIIPGNNTLLVGDSSGLVTMYSNSKKVTNKDHQTVINSQADDFSPQNYEKDDESLSKLSPLIHFLYKPGLAASEEPPTRLDRKFGPQQTLMIGVATLSVILLIVAVVSTVRFCMKGSARQKYENILQSDSEGEEEELLYDRQLDDMNMRAL